MASIYIDHFSQPSRACMVFARINSCGLKEEVINLVRGDHRKAGYLCINAFGRVPCLKDGDFTLPESAAILHYLAVRPVRSEAGPASGRAHNAAALMQEKHEAPEHWWPRRSDLTTRARANAALFWFASTLRPAASRLVFHSVLAPRMKRPMEPGVVHESERSLAAALRELEEVFLDGGRQPFVLRGGE